MTKPNQKNNSNPMWGGHFEQGPDAVMEAINASISFDQRLYAQDIQGSVAHCQMLVKQKILTKAEGKQILDGLAVIKNEIENGEFEFKAALEDIHMNIEARLKELIGDVAGKLHTARSRNDQVATDFKLYLRENSDHIDELLADLQSVLIEQAEKHHKTVMPGFTHLQTAQPVTLGHHLMAYVEMFGRDRSRLQDARKRLNFSPLGSAALAGTSFPIDRDYTAKQLGFDGPTTNSLDAVSDRDFAIELLSLLSILAMHLSRLAEEIVLWMSSDFSFIKLSDKFTSGSSIMPQKRNPDAAELVRAKTGRTYGNLISLLTMMKALPLAYSKDMQEDKEPVFEALDHSVLCLNAMIGMLHDMQVNEAKLHEAARRGYSTATDLADWLVQNLGLPFRECHHITGKIVQMAERKECELSQLSLGELQSIESRITKNILEVLSVEKSVQSRNSFGGTSPKNVLKAAKDAKKRFSL